MAFKKKSKIEEDDSNLSIDITDELCYAVAEAVLFRDDIIKAICKVAKCQTSKALRLQNEILNSNKYKEIFEDYKQTIKGTVYEDDQDTILVQYNNLIRKATQEKKYEVVVRILDKIRQLQAIGDKEMEFKMTFSFKPTETTNLKLIEDNNDKKI